MPATFVPLDGRLTSLETLNIALTGDEVMEIVSPGNAEEGNNYQVTIAVLAAYFSSFIEFDTVVIISGATVGTPYDILVSTDKILLNKTIASASFLIAPLASSMTAPSVFIKDLKGDADVNPIQISFTGGELCDGLSTLTIDNPYGWVTINPVPGGGGWYQS